MEPIKKSPGVQPSYDYVAVMTFSDGETKEMRSTSVVKMARKLRIAPNSVRRLMTGDKVRLTCCKNLTVSRSPVNAFKDVK